MRKSRCRSRETNQNGGSSALSVPCARLLAHMALPNSERFSGDVARIIATAAGTLIS
jgi:hypothetical protein